MNRPRRMAWKLFALMAMASIAANVFLLSKLRSQYESQLTRQIWPGRLPPGPTSSGTTNATGKKVLLLGDSRMFQWGTPDIQGYEFINAGIPGATTAELLSRTRAALDACHPAVVAIEAGVNDIKLLGLRPDLRHAVIANALSNLSNVVVECSSRQCKVILLEVWPTGTPELARRLVWSSAVPDSIPVLNEQLRSLQKSSKDIQVVDLWKQANLSAQNDVFLDALHIKPESYKPLTRELEKAITSSQ